MRDKQVTHEEYLNAVEIIQQYLKQIEDIRNDIRSLPIKKYLRNDDVFFDKIVDIELFDTNTPVEFCGIYFLINKDKQIIYIGQAQNLKKRLQNHNHLDKGVKHIYYMQCSKRDMNLLEQIFINHVAPNLNIDIQPLNKEYVSDFVNDVIVDLPVLRMLISNHLKMNVDEFKTGIEYHRSINERIGIHASCKSMQDAVDSLNIQL